MVDDNRGDGRTSKGRFAKGVSGNPGGLRTDKAEPRSGRFDGWASALTGIGMSSRDKRLSHQFFTDTITYRDAMELWRGDDLAKRAIEDVPDQCFRAGYEVTIADEDAYGNLKEEIEAALERLHVDKMVETAFKWERAYGGGALLLGVNDGQELSEPLNIERIASFDWITPLEPIEIYPLYYYDDPKEEKYGQPKLYQLNAIARGATVGGSMVTSQAERALPPNNTVIHESRLVIFEGVRVSKFQAQTSGAGANWGDSILTRFAGVLRDFNIAWASAGLIVSDFSQSVFSIKDLAQLIANNGQGLKDRLAAIDMARSTARAVIVDKEETFQRQTTSVAGLSDLLDRLSSRLAAAIDMPLTLLMGQSPKGLGNEGESDLVFYYDRIASLQKRKVKPVIRRIIQLITRSLLKAEPKKWDIKFHPLWQQSDKEKAEARSIQATTDEKYVINGILTAKEVRESRFGGDYSFETQLDETDLDEQEAANAQPLDPETLAATGRDPSQVTPGDPDAPAQMGPDGKPVPTGAVAETALNGAQVTALLGIVQAVMTGQIPREGAIAMITSAFPLVSAEEAAAMMGPESFKPTPPEPKPSPFGGGGGGFGGGKPAAEKPEAKAEPDADAKKPDAKAVTDAIMRIDDLLYSLRVERELIDTKFDALAYNRDYNPDQPRDERGRFSEGGGGGRISGVKETTRSRSEKEINEVDRKLTGAGSSQRETQKSTDPDKDKRLNEIGKRMGNTFQSTDPKETAKLPQDHSKYFKDHPEATTVPLSALSNHPDREGAVGRAQERMTKAAHGEHEKREPLVVVANDKGGYDVLDGNHTAQVAKENDWKDVPVRIVDKPVITPPYYTDAESQRMRDTSAPRLEALREAGHLSLTVAQQQELADKVISAHQENLPSALNRFTVAVGGKDVEISGRAKDVNSALQKVADRGEKAVSKGIPLQYKSVADLQDGTGMRAVIPTVKDGSTIDSLRQRVEAIEKTYGTDNIVARDNYVDKPQPGGYRAMHFIVRDKDGLEKEIQLQTRRQQNFQTWSHDVYKPVNATQREVLAKYKNDISSYADKVSDHLFAKDQGRDPGEFDHKLPPEVAMAFGTPRLDHKDV